jgi:hypothetical protein
MNKRPLGTSWPLFESRNNSFREEHIPRRTAVDDDVVVCGQGGDLFVLGEVAVDDFGDADRGGEVGVYVSIAVVDG